jgi:hypothetical protein
VQSDAGGQNVPVPVYRNKLAAMLAATLLS